MASDLLSPQPSMGKRPCKIREIGTDTFRTVVTLVPENIAQKLKAFLAVGGNLLTDVQCREPVMGYPEQKALQCISARHRKTHLLRDGGCYKRHFLKPLI